MDGYSYSPVTGEYIEVITLRESPLEAGVHLVPAHCTTTAPPEAQAGFAACWAGEVWVLVEDHRGEAGYVNGAASVVTDLGAYPEGWSTTPPAPDPNAAIDAQILALEALQTPRLVREALRKKQVEIEDAASVLHGLTPEEAIAFIDTQVEALRGQRSQE